MTRGDKLSVLVGDRPRADGLIKVVHDTGKTGYVPVNLLMQLKPDDDVDVVPQTVWLLMCLALTPSGSSQCL